MFGKRTHIPKSFHIRMHEDGMDMVIGNRLPDHEPGPIKPTTAIGEEAAAFLEEPAVIRVTFGTPEVREGIVKLLERLRPKE